MKKFINAAVIGSFATCLIGGYLFFRNQNKELKIARNKIKKLSIYNHELEKTLIETKFALANISDELWEAKQNQHHHFKNAELNKNK